MSAAASYRQAHDALLKAGLKVSVIIYFYKHDTYVLRPLRTDQTTLQAYE